MHATLSEMPTFVTPRSKCSAESARLFGLTLLEAITRGSQYRVEGTLLRVAKGLGYTLPSPTKEEVGNQRSLQERQEIMLPDMNHQFNTDPVVCVDFQSLYPSCILAYNLSYDTLLAQLLPADGLTGTTQRLGFANYSEYQSAIGLADTKQDVTSNNSSSPRRATLRSSTRKQ